MKRLVALALVLALPAAAAAGDLGELRRAVARDDRAAVERWLAAEAKAREVDPLAPLGSRPPSREIQERAAALADQELIVGALASAFLRDRTPETRRLLLERLDKTITAKQGLGRDVQQAAKAPVPKPIVFTRLFTARTGQAGKLADPSGEFSPDERAIHVSFTYEGGIPAEELGSRWVFRGPSGPAEIARSALKLQKAADRRQFSFTPAEGTRWQEGIYRVEILGRGSVLAEVDFLVRGREVAAAPPPSPSASTAAPARAAPAPAPGPVSVLNAVLAKDIENGQAKDPVLEYSTARKRVLLWAHVRVAGGGALTARWYALDGGDRVLGEHTLTVPPGESRLAYWLEVADANTKFKRGPFRVDLVSGSRVVQQLPFSIRQAGFLEEMAEALEQFGKELDKAIKGEAK